MPGQHFETEAGADERSGIRVSEPKPLWHRLLGGSKGAVSENGRLRQPTEGRSRGDRRPSVLMLPTLKDPGATLHGLARYQGEADPLVEL